MTNKLFSFFKKNRTGALIGFIYGLLPILSSFFLKQSSEAIFKLVLTPITFVLGFVSIDLSFSILLFSPIIYMFLGVIIQNLFRK